MMDLVAAGLDELHERIAGRFARAEPRTRVREYVSGLVTGLERKNGWTLAEWAGEVSPDGMQRLLRRADWDDLNYPARLATLVAAGVPLLQRDNTGHVVATQTLVRERDIGLFFTSIPDLARQLRDRERLARMRERVWAQRFDFSFDAHAETVADDDTSTRRRPLLHDRAALRGGILHDVEVRRQ